MLATNLRTAQESFDFSNSHLEERLLTITAELEEARTFSFELEQRHAEFSHRAALTQSSSGRQSISQAERAEVAERVALELNDEVSVG